MLWGIFPSCFAWFLIVCLLIGVRSFQEGDDVLSVVPFDSNDQVQQLLRSWVSVAPDDEIKFQSVSTQASVGWFSTTDYLNNCDTVIDTTGIISNTCLYSLEHQNSFFISCTDAGAVVNIYNSSTCSGIATTNKTYPTDQCLPNYQLTVQYQCGNDLSSIPLPFGYRYILYSYFNDRSCSNSIQFGAYTDPFCYIQNGKLSLKFAFPNKIVFDNLNCGGPGTVTPLHVNNCFDWPDAYGYSEDDRLNPYSPYLVISSVSTGTGSAPPSRSPTIRPTRNPTNTFRPTQPPSFRPTTTAPPTVSPSISLAPTISLRPTAIPSASPSTAIPSNLPTAAPSTAAPSTFQRFSLTMPLVLNVTNLACSALQSEARMPDLVASTVIACASTDPDQYSRYLVTLITFSAADAQKDRQLLGCSISLTLSIDVTTALGFGTAGQAFNVTVDRIETNFLSGKIQNYWKSYAQQFKLGQYANAVVSSVSFGRYSSTTKSSGSSGSSHRRGFSSGTIITLACTVVLVVLGFPLVLMAWGYMVRKVWALRNRIRAVPQADVEIVSAHFINEEGDLFTNVLPGQNLPTAKPIQYTRVMSAAPTTAIVLEPDEVL